MKVAIPSSETGGLEDYVELHFGKAPAYTTFLSPVALIFLTGFLGAALIIFFLGYKFFSKNVADVRPFFTCAVFCSIARRSLSLRLPG